MRTALLNISTGLILGAAAITTGALTVQSEVSSARVHLAPVASSPRGWHACQQEDSAGPCVWDAQHTGNGVGDSYIRTRAGRVIYVRHAVAHAVLNGR